VDTFIFLAPLLTFEDFAKGVRTGVRRGRRLAEGRKVCKGIVAGGDPVLRRLTRGLRARYLQAFGDEAPWGGVT
jgi:hypothetical protein